jgi:hypothetical protein
MSTTTTNWWDELTEEARREITDGEATYAALKRGETVERWLAVGKALARIQDEIVRVSGSNAPKGRRYNDAEKRLGLRQHAPHLVDINPTTRSHAVWLATEWEAANAWLQTLDIATRLQKNHPTTIRRGYDAARRTPRRDAAAVGRVSPVAGYKQRIIELEAENQALRERLRRADDGPLLHLDGDTGAVIWREISNAVGERKARDIARAINAALAAKTEAG